MPIYTFECPLHKKFDQIVKIGINEVTCPYVYFDDFDVNTGKNVVCGEISKRIEQEIPAKRNPRYGEG